MKHTNQKGARKTIQLGIALCLMIVIALCGAVPAFAVEDTQNEHTGQTLRVAFYPLDGFFEYDASGQETGYGVELLNKISQYTGLKFVYVKAESWSDTKRMLLDGTADIRMPATMSVTPSADLSYSAASVIDTYQVLLTKSDRDDLNYQDYETIKTLKIAVTNSFYKNTTVKAYFDEIGIAEEQLVFTSDFNESYEKMLFGEVDALATNIMDLDDSMKMLARFNNISNYITMVKDNSALYLLDSVLAQIKLDEPLYLSRLYEKWFPERTVTPLTKEEQEYLSSIGYLTFAFRTNEGYLQRYENGQYYGIYVETAKYICDKLGVDFRAVTLPDDLQPSCVDSDVIYPGFFYDKTYAELWGLSLSSPVKDISYYIIQKKEASINHETCRIAAVAKFKYTSDYLKKQYRDEQFVYCDTYEECLLAIKNGKADIAIMNNYIAEYYLELYQFGDLSAHLLSDYSHLYCFAASENNELLVSILSKMVSSLTSEEVGQITILGQENKPEFNLWAAIAYRNPLQFAMAVSLGLVLLVVLIFMIVFINHNRKKNAILQKALSSKTEFLARMSHDMRTPLNAVLSFSRLALEDLDNPASVSDSLLKIESSGDYLLGLINEVLDAAKMESGKLELHPEIVNGPEFLSDIANEFTAQTKLKGVILKTNLQSNDNPWVKLDKLRTRQIYSNLLNNAVKFSEPGSVIEWDIKDMVVDETNMAFVVTIADHGCGMSREFMEHMFEPFTQERVNGNAGQEGTGLGLSIVKKLVELSGGTIEVWSELGKGTVFTLHMTREVPTQQELRAFLQNGEELDEGALAGKRVLLCEDHPLNREIALRLLKKKAIDCETAENGQVGIEKIERSAVGYYDAILMDVRMPVMDGLEAAKVIRRLSRADAKTVPIISMTANAYEDDKKVCLDAGMTDYMPKPINPKTLYEMLVKYTVKKDDT